MKSALRSNLILILISSLLLLGAAVKDRYFFRINQTVVGLHDLEIALDDMRALECRFPDSLLLMWLGNGFLPQLKKVTKDLSSSTESVANKQSQVIFMSMVRQWWKVLVFTDSQEVALTADLEKKVAKVKECPSVNFADKTMRDSFRRWLRVEIYLRSRYAPSGMGENKDWKEKRLHSITQFVESIDKQLAHENFW